MIHISNIYVCTEINTPSELLYIAEIAKYLKECDEELSLEGVIISENCIGTEYYKYMQSMNIAGIPYRELENARDFYVESLSDKDIYYAEKTPTEWVFDYDGKGRKPQNSKYFKGLLASKAYVSLIAMITVNKLMFGSPKLLRLDFTQANVCFTKNYDRWDILDLWLVLKRTNALESWVQINLPEIPSALAQLNYEAHTHELQTLGGMKDFVGVKKKIDCYRKNFKKGDIVLLYKKSDRGSKNDIIKSIASCQIARIEQATNSKIELTIFNVHNSSLSAKKYFDSLPDKVREMYGDNAHLKVHEQRIILDWLDVGIGDCVFAEEYIVTDLDCDDKASLWFTNKRGEEVLLELNNADAIYAILCDRGIPFNRERFEKLYFSDVPSVYKTRILN